MTKKLIAFDLDDTLAVTKSPITPRMSELLSALLEKYEVCIISGGRFEQFKIQVLDQLSDDPLLLKRLHLMPTCGTRYYKYTEADKGWELKYTEDLPEDKKKEVITVLEDEAKKAGIWREDTWGDIIEDRGSQITYSALGQQAPPEEKYRWAEEFEERKRLFRDSVAKRVPDLEIRLGGTTSLDITRPGTDKAYGMKKLIEATGISRDEILFIGDKLEEGGNDYPVKAMGIECIAVNGWEETALIMQAIVAVN